MKTATKVEAMTAALLEWETIDAEQIEDIMQAVRRARRVRLATPARATRRRRRPPGHAHHQTGAGSLILSRHPLARQLRLPRRYGAENMSAASLHAGRFVLSLDRPLIMGILNVTPVRSRMAAAIGAWPPPAPAPRPCWPKVPTCWMWAAIHPPECAAGVGAGRAGSVLPVLEALCELDVPISLDTRRTEVMRAGLALGWTW